MLLTPRHGLAVAVARFGVIMDRLAALHTELGWVTFFLTPPFIYFQRKCCHCDYAVTNRFGTDDSIFLDGVTGVTIFGVGDTIFGVSDGIFRDGVTTSNRFR